MKRNENSVKCCILPFKPLPILLPVECIAEVVASPQIAKAAESSAEWMLGTVSWQGQDVPVISFAKLTKSQANDKASGKPCLVVLEPIPGAISKSHCGILCHGEIEQLELTEQALKAELPREMDSRYVESVLRFKHLEYIVPKLAALSVAFTYI